MSHSCWGLEVDVVVLLMVLAGLVILALLYRTLLLRHKLRLAQAGNALEYFGFYHMARYDLKEASASYVVSPPPAPLLTPSEGPPPPQTPVVPPLPPMPSLLPLPPPPPTPLLPLPLPHPIIYTTPPSPLSDGEVYSRIGALRTSRPSSVSQTQVVLFEHSSL